MAGEKVTTIPKLLKDSSHRQYLPGDLLGSGGFATCWRTRVVDRREAPETEECALKAVRAVLPKNIAWRFKLELAIQSKLHHPNVVEMYRAFTCQDVTYVALELCPNGSLTEMIKKRKFLTMGEIRRMLIQLCGAVKYLHERDVVHRDIKAGNIFLDGEMNVKLGDFGLAAIMEPGDAVAEYARRTTFCGTPNYLAPEILCKEGGHGISVDIWAIGVLAYFLAVGKAPFSAKTKEEIYEKLRKGDYSWPELAPEQNEIPEDLRNLVASLLVEESKRPTPDQIVRHQFFTHGYIPTKLDPLCKTRRPKFARIGTIQENARVYEALCRSSHVGVVSMVEPGKVKRKKSKSIAIALAEEYAQGVKLTIPLKEGIVYLGRRPASPATIFEDKANVQQGILPDTTFNAPQAGVLAERVANRGTKMPTLDQRKVLLGVEADLLANQEHKALVLPVVSDARKSPRKEEKQHARQQQRKIEDSVVFVSHKPVPSHPQPLEQKTVPTASEPKEVEVERLVEAAQSKSKTENPATYRLKVEHKVSAQASELPLQTTTDKTKVNAVEVQQPAVNIRRFQTTATQSPKPLPKHLHDNHETHERPKSQMIANKQLSSPRLERRNFNPPIPLSPLVKPERRRPLTSSTQMSMEAQLENIKLSRTDKASVPSTNQEPTKRMASTSTTSSRKAPTPSSPAPSASVNRPPPPPPTQRSSSITLAAAAAAAAAVAAATAMTTSRVVTNTTTPQDLPPAPLRRARTLGRSRPPRQTSILDPFPPQPQTDLNPTTLTRATTLRVSRRPARGIRGGEKGLQNDEKVMAGVEREIAEMLKLAALASAAPANVAAQVPTFATTSSTTPLSALSNTKESQPTHRSMRRAASTRAPITTPPTTTTSTGTSNKPATSGSETDSAATAAVAGVYVGVGIVAMNTNANAKADEEGNGKGVRLERTRTVRMSARPRRAGVNYGGWAGVVAGVGV